MNLVLTFALKISFSIDSLKPVGVNFAEYKALIGVKEFGNMLVNVATEYNEALLVKNLLKKYNIKSDILNWYWKKQRSNIQSLARNKRYSLLINQAKKLNIKTVIYSDDQDAPAQNFCDEFIFGDYEDKNKINDFAKKVSIVTYEFENIPYETLNEINKFKTVNPKPSINRLIQHRLAEKDFVNKLNIRTTRYVSIEKKSDLETLGDFLPGILKTATMGYDGKGQYPIKSPNELNGLNIDFSKEYILEKLVKLKKEISVIVTRFGNNRYEIYEAIENIHENQILKKSKIPADISNKLVDQSREWSKQISEELKYIGTLCVEFFIDRNDNLYVNEIAPRVHNSGHLTINAFNISQFENHIRAVCSLEQIPLKKLHNAEMINLIGNQITPYRQNINLNDNEFFFDYQKKEIKDKRKMGHLTKIL